MKHLNFMEACGITSKTTAHLEQTNLFTSHEALLLNYEEAFTRQDSITGDWYNFCTYVMDW